MPKDLFSGQAKLYAHYRPGYPEALIEYIISFVSEKSMAWDCATGNGQAALMLAPYFKKIYATDISAGQVSHAVSHPAITYSVGQAETTLFADNSFDLITVAQAYHWFKFAEFFQEATRRGKPGCVVAVWGYGLIETGIPALQEAIRHFYSGIVGSYWDPERRYVDERYQTIPFGFERLPGRDFSIEVTWKPPDLLGYLNTWSSVQHFIKDKGFNPVDEFAQNLNRVWISEDPLTFTFPLFLLLGRVKK
jgi:hypothetical protein